MTSRDIAMATLSLRAYAVGLVAFMLIKVLAPGYYARQDIKTPVRIGVIALVTNMGLNIALAVPLHLYWGIGHVGLALATSLSAMLNAGLLLRGLRKGQVYAPEAGWSRFLVQLLAANVTMGLVLYGLTLYMNEWLQWLWWQRASWMGLLCAGGALAYSAILLAGGLRLSHLKHR